MSRQRTLAVAFFSVVIVVVLAAIIYTDRVSSTNTVPVYVLSRDVPAQGIVATEDFVQQLVHADENEFLTAEDRPLEQLVGQTRYLINMKAHDILRKDDLSPAQKNAEVPLNLGAAGATVFTPGDRIDVYVFYNGQAVLVSGANGLPVVSTGTPVIVSVPAEKEAYWVTLAFAKPEMIATRSGGGLPKVQSTNTVPLAICTLSGDPAICDAANNPTTPPAR